MPLCDKELEPSNNNFVEWHKFEKVLAGQIRSGEQKEVTRLETKLTSSREFLTYVAPKFEKLCCVIMWQSGKIQHIGPILKN